MSRPLTSVPLPAWWSPLAERAAAIDGAEITKYLPPRDGGRPSAVLVLLGENAPGFRGGTPVPGPDVLILERAASLRDHAGQCAFPGGGTEPGDADLVATALREAQEEVGLDPATVEIVTALPDLWVPVSDYVVTPVLAWWREPHLVYAADRAEVSRVERLPIAELVDAANRLKVRHPSGHVGPAFQVRDLLVWGFTGGIVAKLLELGGWARPWDQSRVEDLPPRELQLAEPPHMTGDGAGEPVTTD